MKEQNNTPKNINAKEDMWKNIESNILTDRLYREVNREVLQQSINKLPVITPQKNIWECIDSQLPMSAEPKIKFLKVYKAVAASIVLFLVSYVLFINNPFKVGSQENCHTGDESVEVFLDQICSTYPAKCKSPDFIELQETILMLHEEQSDLHQQVFYNPGDEQMKRINEKIETQISFLKKQIETYVTL